MDWFPKDVQSIVYRYVCDANYKRVRREYADVWLRGEFQWDSYFDCFADRHWISVMNYRSTKWYTNHHRHIYTTCRRSRITPSVLPNRYWYSAGDRYSKAVK